MTITDTDNRPGALSSRSLSGGDLIHPFTSALLQRGRHLRNPSLCPHCRQRLWNGNEIIDLGPKGLRCSLCYRQTD